VAVSTPWSDPGMLHRCWCLRELLVAFQSITTRHEQPHNEAKSCAHLLTPRGWRNMDLCFDQNCTCLLDFLRVECAAALTFPAGDRARQAGARRAAALRDGGLQSHPGGQFPEHLADGRGARRLERSDGHEGGGTDRRRGRRGCRGSTPARLRLASEQCLTHTARRGPCGVRTYAAGIAGGG